MKQETNSTASSTSRRSPRFIPPAISPALDDELHLQPILPKTPGKSSAAMAEKIVYLQEQLRSARTDAAMILVAAVEAKDHYTADHSLHVSQYAARLSAMLNLPSPQIESITMAALLHDVGKIGIPDAILTCPRKLTTDEYERMKMHPAIGDDILRKMPCFAPQRPLVLHHHEWFDGSGYPDGLAGEAIPLGSRIIHIVDSIDVMLSARAYKPAFSSDRVRAELLRGCGRQFDPQITAVALDWLTRFPEQMIVG